MHNIDLRFISATQQQFCCFYKITLPNFFYRIIPIRNERNTTSRYIYIHTIHTISIEASNFSLQIKFIRTTPSNSMIEFHRIFFFDKFNDMSTNHVTRSIAITVAAPFEILFVNSIEMICVVPSLKKAITLFFHARLYTRDGRSNRDRNGTSTQRIRA